MENFFKSVLSTLSFLLMLFFCLFNDSTKIETPRSASAPVAPMIKSVQFEQAPAIVNIGENKNENEFNWKN